MPHLPETKVFDTIIIGGGQAGLSVAYFLRRKSLDYLILDEQSEAGGAWLHTWDSLDLFSPSKYSSLSGWQMPTCENEYPTKNEFIKYVTDYQKRYDFPIQRDTTVEQVSKEGEVFKIETNKGKLYARSVVSATGTAKAPFIPSYPNANSFLGNQIHSVDYKNNQNLVDKKVLVVGGGNSGAQILAEVAKVAQVKWSTRKPPVFLPEEIDGSYLFNQATKRYFNNETEVHSPEISLSNIVQVAGVKEGLEKGIFESSGSFKGFYEEGVIWEDDTKEPFDEIIWCTGFRPNLNHLMSLGITKNNKIETKQTRSVEEPGLWLVGYGNWTVFASATIFGVGKTAKQAVEEITAFIKTGDSSEAKN